MSAAYYVWTFILIGNAVALFALSALTAGGTSAMGHSSTASREVPPKF